MARRRVAGRRRALVNGLDAIFLSIGARKFSTFYPKLEVDQNCSFWPFDQGEICQLTEN